MMKIEVKEKGSDAFYREIVNISAQYRQLIKNHGCKLRDFFTEFKRLLIAGAVVLGLLILMCVFWGFRTIDYVAIGFLFLAVIMCFAYLYLLNRYRKSMIDEAGESILTLDEDGVELSKKDTQVIRNTWNNIAFVRLFNESICFIPRTKTGIMICITREFAKQIQDWLKENKPEIEVI
jgi:hypothetical protein